MPPAYGVAAEGISSSDLPFDAITAIVADPLDTNPLVAAVDAEVAARVQR